eukprot:14706482-Alexandrium_andersonii.AAC.1
MPAERRPRVSVPHRSAPHHTAFRNHVVQRDTCELRGLADLRIAADCAAPVWESSKLMNVRS